MIQTKAYNAIKTALLGSLDKYKGKVYLCGGSVRDYYINGSRVPKDIDLLICDFGKDGGIQFATDVCKLFGVYSEGSNPVIFERFGTAKFTLYGEDIECIFPRKEEYDGITRNPVVKSGVLLDDILRRDFTINALLYDITTGNLIDYSGSIDDIKQKVIRTNTNPEITFDDDPLRMLRAIRFACRFDYDIDPMIYSVLKEKAHLITRISYERIQAEIMKMLSEDPEKVVRSINMMLETGLVSHIIPELIPMVSCGQNRYHNYKTVMEHTLCCLEQTHGYSPLSRLAVLLHDVGKPPTLGVHKKTGEATFYKHDLVGADMVVDIMKRLKFSNTEICAVKTAVFSHMRLYDIMIIKPYKRIAMYDNFKNHKSIILDVLKADCLGMPLPTTEYEYVDTEFTFIENRYREIGGDMPNGNDVIAKYEKMTKNNPTLIKKLLCQLKAKKVYG